MARKDRSFAAKLAHAGVKHVMECPVCHKDQHPYMVVRAMKSERSGSWRFRKTHVKICGCNKDEFGL